MAHNFAKMNWTLEELGWDLRPPGDLNAWDGLIHWFVEYTKAQSDSIETIAGAPWEQGYLVARYLRKELNLDGKVLRSLDDVSQALNVNSTELRKAICPQLDHLNTFEAVVDVNDAGSPGFVITHKREDALKFSFELTLNMLEEVIDDLADEFGVSAYVVVYQLQNHRLAKTVPV